MIRFYNIKQGKEIEGKHAGMLTLFLSVTDRSTVLYTRRTDKGLANNIEKLYDPELILEELYSPTEHEHVYIVDNTVHDYNDDKQYLFNIINRILKDCTVTLETRNPLIEVIGPLVGVGGPSPAHLFKYVYRVDEVEIDKHEFNWKNIQAFIKYQTQDSKDKKEYVFVNELFTPEVYMNSREEEKNDIQMLPRTD